MNEWSASDLLYAAWQEGRVLAELPASLRPASRAAGYAIQACLERRSEEPIYGWKIAATSRFGQEHVGVDGPIAGRLLADRVLPSGGSLALGPNRMRVAEPEFAFRMGRTLAPRPEPYAVEEVMAAVAALYPAIEVPDSRYEDFTTVGAAQLIADNACAHWFVLGEPAPELWRELDLAAHEATVSIVGGASYQGRGANVLGDPRVALAWIANELSSIGVPLAEGQVVTTGACVTPLPVGEGDAVVADFGVLGRVTITFA